VGHLDILRALYGRVLIPEAVFREVGKRLPIVAVVG
jgi:predicted nucleic acid-binding protein